MNPLECKACFEEYHPTTRRPRALPCGHSYCEPCLGILKTNQMIRCPTCRREHNVTDVTELMIVYDLIELIDNKQPKAKVSISKGECDEHGCPLNFFCATHKEWICRDCTVLEHLKEKCSIMTKKQFVQEKVAKEKEKIIAEKENNEKYQSNLRKNCNEIKTEIVIHEELITKLQSILESHVHKKTSLEMEAKSTENSIKEIGVKNDELISMIPSISAITDFDNLEVALKQSEELMSKAQDWKINHMKEHPDKLNHSSDKIIVPVAELINLTLEYTQPSTVHDKISCDECKRKNIQGVRYCCLVCNDYDICANCENRGLHRHHAKMQIPKRAMTIHIDVSSGVLDYSGRKDPICSPANVLFETQGMWDSKKMMTRGCWNPCDLPRHYNNWYIVFDLKSSHTVIRINISNFGDTTHDILECMLESSTDNKNWNSAGKKFVAKTGTKQIQFFGNFHATGRFWKFTVLRTPKGFQPWLPWLNFHGYQN